MSGEASYVIDANVLIAAHRQYYGFDICPGFWKSVLEGFDRDQMCSIDKVKAELENEPDILADWVKNRVPPGFFDSSDESEVIRAYAEMMIWVEEQEQFTREAKEEFAKTENADGWLIAYAKATGKVLVTHEVFAEHAKKRVPMPNVCREFSVPYVNTFEMLRALEACFE